MGEKPKALSTPNYSLVQRISGAGLLCVSGLLYWVLMAEPVLRTDRLGFVMVSLFGACFLGGAFFLLDSPGRLRFPMRVLQGGFLCCAFAFPVTLAWWMMSFG